MGISNFFKFFKDIFFGDEGRIDKDINDKEQKSRKLLQSEQREKQLQKIDEKYCLRENRYIRKITRLLTKAKRIAPKQFHNSIDYIIVNEAAIRNNDLMFKNKRVYDQEQLTKSDVILLKKMVEVLKTLIIESEKEKNLQLASIFKRVKILLRNEYRIEKRKYSNEQEEEELLKEEDELLKDIFKDEQDEKKAA